MKLTIKKTGFADEVHTHVSRSEAAQILARTFDLKRWSKYPITLEKVGNVVLPHFAGSAKLDEE